MSGLGAGSSTGAAVITAGMLLFRSVYSTGSPDDIGAGFTLITAVLVAGTGAAAVVGFYLTRSLQEPWRRAVIGGLSVFGTALLAAVAAPVDTLAGRIGLTVYLIVLATVAAIAWRAAVRAASR